MNTLVELARNFSAEDLNIIKVTPNYEIAESGLDCKPECNPNCNPSCHPNCVPSCNPQCSPNCRPCYPHGKCDPQLFG